MNQRIKAGSRNVLVDVEIPCGIEQRMRSDALSRAYCEIVLECFCSVGGVFWKLRPVPFDIEQGVGGFVLVLSLGEIVNEWVDPCLRNILILSEIPRC